MRDSYNLDNLGGESSQQCGSSAFPSAGQQVIEVVSGATCQQVTDGGMSCRARSTSNWPGLLSRHAENNTFSVSDGSHLNQRLRFMDKELASGQIAILTAQQYWSIPVIFDTVILFIKYDNAIPIPSCKM